MDTRGRRIGLFSDRFRSFQDVFGSCGRRSCDFRILAGVVSDCFRIVSGRFRTFLDARVRRIGLFSDRAGAIFGGASIKTGTTRLGRAPKPSKKIQQAGFLG